MVTVSKKSNHILPSMEIIEAKTELDEYRDVTIILHRNKNNPLGSNCGLVSVSNFHVGVQIKERMSTDFRRIQIIMGKPVDPVSIIKAFNESMKKIFLDPTVLNTGGRTLVFSDSESKTKFCGTTVDPTSDKSDRLKAEKILVSRTRDLYYWAKENQVGIISKTRTFTNPMYRDLKDNNQICVYTWQPHIKEGKPDKNKRTEGESLSFVEE